MNDFHRELAMCISRNNIVAANELLMQEVGKAIVHHRADFIALLSNSDAQADADMADAYLIDLYMNNIHKKDLILGTAFLVNNNNKMMGADGDSEISDQGVKQAYQAMISNFSGWDYQSPTGFLGIPSPTGDQVAQHRMDWAYDWFPEGQHRTDSSGEFLTRLDKKSDFVGTAMVAKNFVKNTLGAAKNQEKAKSDIAKSALAERNKQRAAALKAKEAKDKNLRVGLIVGGSVLGIAIIATAIYFIKKRN